MRITTRIKGVGKGLSNSEIGMAQASLGAALRGPLTPPLHRKGPQGLVSRPADRGPRDQSLKSAGTGGHPSKTPRPGK